MIKLLKNMRRKEVLMVLLCTVLFVACTAHIRLRLKHAKLAAAPDEPTTRPAP